MQHFVEVAICRGDGQSLEGIESSEIEVSTGMGAKP
jgi:hypothetical protein